MSFLKDFNHQPLVLWHGTCAEFDEFYPLSQFAVDKHISESSEFYTRVRQPPKERFHADYDEKMWQENKNVFLALLNPSHPQNKPIKKEKRPDFKVIPVHLKIKTPLILHRWGFDLEPSCSELVWSLLKIKNDSMNIKDSTAYGDFIFKDSYQAP